MVYVFHSSLKHKRLISLPCGGQEGGETKREAGNQSQKEWSLFLGAVYFFIRAEVHMPFQVVWGAGACRSGSCGFADSLYCDDVAANAH